MTTQELLFDYCKLKEPEVNLASSISDLLSINLDSAYRRIRGETSLSIEEIKRICRHFEVSFDQIINLSGPFLPFQFNSMFGQKFEVIHYLETIANVLQQMSNEPTSEIALTAMDIPYFRMFSFPHLSKFKFFYWQKSVLNIEQFRSIKFNIERKDTQFDKITKVINKHYLNVNSTEIWAPETLDSTIKQIKYYVDSGLFLSVDDALHVCNDLLRLLDRLEREAELGAKLNDDGHKTGKTFAMYQSDLYLSNNCIQAHRESKTYTYISFNSFNYLMSYSPYFSNECSQWIKQIRLKSILLSEVSEKLRYQFFQLLRGKVQNMITEISN